MKRSYNVKGERRKELALLIGRILETEPAYTGVPEFAYVIGDFKVSKIGELTCSEDTAEEVIKKVTDEVRAAGFVAEEDEQTSETEPGMTVSMPRSSFTDEALENLKKIVASKETLLKKSLGAEALPIVITDETVSFPWFNDPENDADVFATYAQLIDFICRMARTAKRVTAVERETESEKYTFRAFLLRLGFVGPEYKKMRELLLKNLSGYAAFKNQAEADAFYEKQKAKKQAKNKELQESVEHEEDM